MKDRNLQKISTIPIRQNNKLLSSARHLFKISHQVSPFMTLNSSPDGCNLDIKFKNLEDGQAFYTALVRFFSMYK